MSLTETCFYSRLYGIQISDQKWPSLVYYNSSIIYQPLLAIQTVKFGAPLDFAIVELIPPNAPNMFVEILCRCETSFAHASLCLKYHALDPTSTIIQSLKIGSEKCAKVKQINTSNYFPLQIIFQTTNFALRS